MNLNLFFLQPSTSTLKSLAICLAVLITTASSSDAARVDELSKNVVGSTITIEGNLTEFRWDFSNAIGNEGKTFTIDRLVFGTAVTAIPEPSSTFFVAVCGEVVSMRCRRNLS